MLVERRVQSMPWKPATPMIRPSWMIASCTPRFSSAWRRAARMKASESRRRAGLADERHPAREMGAVGVDQLEELLGVGVVELAQRAAVAEVRDEHRSERHPL